MTTPPASLPPYHEKGLDLDIDNSDLESTYSDAASTPSTSTALFTDASTIPSPPSPILAPLPFLQQPSPPLTRDATPWPDSTYILLHVATRRPLTLLQGKATLAPISTTSPPAGCIHWTCVQHDGWLGLRNAASWTYLGRNFQGQIEASAGHHRWWEYLCARRHPEGGYVLLNVNCVAHVMEKIGVADDGCSLVLREEAAVWEFIKVHS